MSNLIAIPIILFAALVFGLIKLMSMPCSDKMKGAVTWAKKTLFSIIVRYILMSFLSVCITANYGALFYKEKESFALNWFLVAYIGIVITFSVWIAFFIENQELEEKSMRDWIGSAYQGVKTETNAAMLNTALFLTRRLLFVMALTSQNFSVQYGGIMNLVLFNASFLLSERPYASRAMNNLETFNEIFMMLCMYFMPLFSDWVTTTQA